MRAPHERPLQLLARLGVYVAFAYVGLRLLGGGLYWASANLLLTSTLATFGSGLLANALAMRIYEQAPLNKLGLAWTKAGKRNLLLGLAAGAGVALLLVGTAVAVGAAEVYREAAGSGGWDAVLFLLVLLWLGAIGEELLFHGYGFQLLLGAVGPLAAIMPVSVIFALAHTGNLNITLLGLANTFGWGLLLGYAFWRSKDLWLPIGLHAGWNCALPLAGVPLSGFTMNVTGYAVRWKAGPLWSGGDYGLEGSILTSGAVLLIGIALSRAPVSGQRAFLLESRGED